MSVMNAVNYKQVLCSHKFINSKMLHTRARVPFVPVLESIKCHVWSSKHEVLFLLHASNWSLFGRILITIFTENDCTLFYCPWKNAMSNVICDVVSPCGIHERLPDKALKKNETKKKRKESILLSIFTLKIVYVQVSIYNVKGPLFLRR